MNDEKIQVTPHAGTWIETYEIAYKAVEIALKQNKDEPD